MPFSDAILNITSSEMMKERFARGLNSRVWIMNILTSSLTTSPGEVSPFRKRFVHWYLKPLEKKDSEK